MSNILVGMLQKSLERRLCRGVSTFAECAGSGLGDVDLARCAGLDESGACLVCRVKRQTMRGVLGKSAARASEHTGEQPDVIGVPDAAEYIERTTRPHVGSALLDERTHGAPSFIAMLDEPAHRWAEIHVVLGAEQPDVLFERALVDHVSSMP